MIWIPFGLLFLISKLNWAAMKIFVTMFKTDEILGTMAKSHPKYEECQNLKGNELVDLKV